jgi:hypothetical protein
LKALVRLIKVILPNSRFEILATSLLDQATYPASEFGPKNTTEIQGTIGFKASTESIQTIPSCDECTFRHLKH